MKTSLGDNGSVLTVYLETEPGEFGLKEASAFQVDLYLRKLAPLLIRAKRSLRITSSALGGAIVVTQKEPMR